jgi:uncharacterized protein YjbI with pentapeptide repeats
LNGADFSGATLDRVDMQLADLKGANLSGVTLISSVLYAVDLAGANLSNSNLAQATFNSANLSQANFQNATMNQVDMVGAKLENADFRNAKLQGVSFVNADLQGANFEGAQLLGEVNLEGANIAQAIGLSYKQGSDSDNTVQAPIPVSTPAESPKQLIKPKTPAQRHPKSHIQQGLPPPQKIDDEGRKAK